jgi:phosphate transport system substrate-binding protein
MSKRFYVLAIAAVATFVVALQGCSKPPAPGTSTPGTDAAQASGAAVTIKGSDTMVHLVTKWTEDYTNAHTGANLIVTGGGSGTGVAALINGTTDICMASRSMSEKEKADAAGKGRAPVEHVVALDGIAIVTHKSNPLNDITIEQLGKIYRGEVKNWSEIGGPDQKIIALSRESTSGTYVFFQEHVLQKKDYGADVRLLPSTAAIVQGAETDAGAIGYVGLGYAHSAGDAVKVLPVKATPDAPAIPATVDTVRSKQYSIARELFFYTIGTPSGAVAQFLDFVKGPEGQKIVEAEGYVALK